LQSKLADVSSEALNWYARVPTGANIADGPSRLEFDHIKSLGGIERLVACPTLAQLIVVDVRKSLNKNRFV
jgi:hypothetical protein